MDIAKKQVAQTDFFALGLVSSSTIGVEMNRRGSNEKIDRDKIVKDLLALV
jgi:hypothetical protein